MRTRCLLGVLALVIASCAAPGTSGAPPDPSPATAWATFSSDRFGYSIGHPADWEVLERVGEVTLQNMRPRHPGTDTIATPDSHELDGRDGIVVIAARELAEGESLEGFTDAASEATTCGPPFGYDTTSLDGEPAEYRKFECGGGPFWVQITAVHDGSGYLVWLVSAVPPRADRRPINDRFLESFRFTD